jgi:hypothetical protein
VLRQFDHPCRGRASSVGTEPADVAGSGISAFYAALLRCFIGSDAYKTHKGKRFRPSDEPDLTKNEAFLLSDPKTREAYRKAYEATRALYYAGRSSFNESRASPNGSIGCEAEG